MNLFRGSSSPSQIKLFSDVNIDFSEEFVSNENGSIRRSKVFKLYQNNKLSNDDVKSLYVKWRDDDEYFILRGTVESDIMQERLIPNNSGIGDTWYIEPEIDYLYKFIKASKRGNDVYKSLVSEKLKLLKNLNEIEFFNEHSVNKQTSLLFLTLTSDTKRCDSKTAWISLEYEYHLFKSNLRKIFGDIETFRTWESTNNYYPHIHTVILFKEHSFSVIEHKDKNGKISYRIPYSIKEKISKYWHSNIDIQALKSTKDAFRELTKYITKDLCSEKGDKTNSQIWLYRKRSYAVSKRFIESIQGWYIDFNEPTNCDLIRNMCNRNQDVIKWEFLGILRGRDLCFFSEVWVIDLKKPPPRVLELVMNEYNRWKRLHSSRFSDYVGFTDMRD